VQESECKSQSARVRMQESECKSQSARALAVKPGTYLDPCPPCLRAAVRSGPKRRGNHQPGTNHCCGSGAGSGGFVIE
jgi:hypothetical protein